MTIPLKNFFVRHLPQDRATWKAYIGVFFPIIISATVIALNGMIDNFMVGHINQGITALGAVNSWTNIFTGLVLATSAAGSIGLAQFYHAKQYAVVREIARLRYTINLTGAAIMFVMTWTASDFMIGMFISKPPHAVVGSVNYESYKMAVSNAETYMQITSAQWILFAISYDIGSQLREVGHAKVTMYTSLVMLAYHIFFNAIALYVLNLGIRGAAIAGATSRLIPIIALSFYIYLKKVEISILPWTLYKISRKAFLIFVKRYIYFLSIFTVTFFITFRNHFYDIGYPVGSLGAGVGGLAIVGLAGSINNIFMTTFSAAPAMTANFVSSELGKGNIQKAKENSDRVKGFNTIVAIGLSLLLLCFSFAVPSMKFIASSGEDSGSGAQVTDVSALLRQVSHATMVVSFWYPIWIWFVTSYRNSQSGGKGKFAAWTDWVVSGPLQLGWQALLAYYVVPNNSYFQHNFWISYFVFFTSDLLKLIAIEIYYYRYTWLHSLTHGHHPKLEQVIATDLKENKQ